MSFLCIILAIISVVLGANGQARRHQKFPNTYHANVDQVLAIPEIAYVDGTAYPSSVVNPETRLEIVELAQVYQINSWLAGRLGNLQGYKIVLLLDDSGYLLRVYILIVIKINEKSNGHLQSVY